MTPAVIFVLPTVPDQNMYGEESSRGKWVYHWNGVPAICGLVTCDCAIFQSGSPELQRCKIAHTLFVTLRHRSSILRESCLRSLVVLFAVNFCAKAARGHALFHSLQPTTARLAMYWAPFWTLFTEIPPWWRSPRGYRMFVRIPGDACAAVMRTSEAYLTSRTRLFLYGKSVTITPCLSESLQTWNEGRRHVSGEQK